MLTLMLLFACSQTDTPTEVTPSPTEQTKEQTKEQPQAKKRKSKKKRKAKGPKIAKQSAPFHPKAKLCGSNAVPLMNCTDADQTIHEVCLLGDTLSYYSGKKGHLKQAISGGKGTIDGVQAGMIFQFSFENAGQKTVAFVHEVEKVSAGVTVTEGDKEVSKSTCGADLWYKILD